MELEPRLIDVATPSRPEGVVLVLHGGASRRADVRVSPTQLSVLRMIPIAKRIARAGKGRVAVFRLLNSRRGWDTSHTPVRDARWALAEIADRLGDPPLCVVGHSLGGRAALLTAADTNVRGVVALAPYVYPTDIPPGLAGQRILIAHGTRDRIASADRSMQLAASLSRHARVNYVSVEGGKHAMLRHRAIFDGLAAEFASSLLLGTTPTGPLAKVADDRLVTEL